VKIEALGLGVWIVWISLWFVISRRGRRLFAAAALSLELGFSGRFFLARALFLAFEKC